jgi:hypothetical protein
MTSSSRHPVPARSRLSRLVRLASIACFSCMAVLTPTSDIPAQTPIGIRGGVNSDLGEGKRGGIAANSMWLGGQLAYRFGGSDSFASDLLASGLFTYDTELGKGWHLPVISNFGGKIGPPAEIASAAEGIEQQMKDLVQSSTGITAGVFPYREIHRGERSLITLHGMTAWRYNALRPYGEQQVAGVATDAGTLVDLQQIKVGAGLEIVVGDRKSPGLTFGVTPVARFILDKDAYKRAFGEERSMLNAVEIVSILPLRADGVGLLFEGVLGGSKQSAFRVGLLLAARP